MARASDHDRAARRVRVLLIAVLGLALVGAACGGDDDDADPVAAAQRRVTDAEKAVSDAQAKVEEASAGFCDDAKAYISAIDRYGDVFQQTAPTVGDVKTAGADLVEPRDAVTTSADSVVAANDDLATAQKDLAEAQSDLAAAQSSTTAAPTTTTTAPLVSASTIDRVKQAESDLTAAAAGITDQTPLTEASEQFNAAAVALEVAWLRVYADAGCLTDDAQAEATAAVVEYTTALQTTLQAAGYYTDQPIDGVYGPATVDAIEQLQKDSGLPVTGYVDRATATALSAAVLAAGGEAANQATVQTASVQSTLKLAGYWTGPVDGTWTPELTDALKSFQTALGVEPTGAVDAATVEALETAIADAQAAATTTTTSTAGEETSTTTAAP